jgi:AcrR family transcriptional regulator
MGDAMSNEQNGRRARRREARHEQLLAAATELIAEHGLGGLTMQAVAERVDCAVGTIYTYFPSKSALLAALQVEAITTLTSSVDRSRAVWDQEIAAAGLDPASAALVRLVAYGHLLVAGPTLHPREFELLQLAISLRRRELTDEDTPAVVTHALGLLTTLHTLIEQAIEVGALTTRPELGDPDAHQTLRRTLRWLGGMNGALLVSNAPSDPSWLSADELDGGQLAISLAQDLLLGWGAPPLTLASANEFVADLARRDQLCRAGITAEHATAGTGDPVLGD